ncbi:MAG: choice-of-anchor L domain-containing protein [Lishizhenia sp.]
MKNYLVVSVVLFTNMIWSQIDITYFTPEDLINDFLIGEGVYTDNIEFTGSAFQIGHYQGTAINFEGTTGVVLSTGRVYDNYNNGVVGPNDLESCGTDFASSSNTPNNHQSIAYSLGVYSSVFDVCKLDFDIIPIGDTLFSSFIFGSEEYPEFVDSEFNDFFAIILENKQTGEKTNLAEIPGTNSIVSVNTLNNGIGNTGPCENCFFYVNNGNGNQSPYDESDAYLQMDGFSKRITVKVPIQTGTEYHVSIVLMDVTDGSYDSNLFFEYSSFSTNEAVLSAEENALENVVIFPNPVDDVLKIEGLLIDDLVTIQDLSGKMVKTIDSQQKEWNVSDLAKGVYLVTFARKGSKEVKKIIKKKGFPLHEKP